jgi:Uma2 family endonuclease
MAIPKQVKLYTPQAYYALERDADYKSEYYKGEIFAMSGGSARHSLISINIGREIGNRLKGKPCRAYESNLRMKVLATGLRTYPNVSVYCGPLEFDDEDPGVETATNPSVLFEVLSKTTEGYDRGQKADNYRQVRTLQAYVLVAQSAPHVEIYERQPTRHWLLREEKGLGATLSIPAIGADLPLSEIYDGVDFSAPEPGPVDASRKQKPA